MYNPTNNSYMIHFNQTVRETARMNYFQKVATINILNKIYTKYKWLKGKVPKLRKLCAFLIEHVALPIPRMRKFNTLEIQYVL